MGLNVESEMCGFPVSNNRFQMSLGARNLADSQKQDLKRASVWKATNTDLLRGNGRCQMSLGVRNLADSQKRDSNLATVWRAQCMDCLERIRRNDN